MNEGVAFEAQLERQQRNRLLQVWIVFRRWPVIPLFILAVMGTFALFAPLLAPKDPLKQSLPLQYVPPIWATEERADRLEGRVDNSFEYFLGTDNLGRDILSRIIYGARISLMVALISLTSGILVGSTLGLIGGWYGGIIDELVARLVDIWYALPFLLVALVVVIVLGQTLVVMMFVLALTAWSPFVRNVRAEVLSLKERDYVALARVAGASPFYIMYKHILPGVINTIVVIATLNVGGLILAEATLTFLGAGLPSNIPAWGLMVGEGQGDLRAGVVDLLLARPGHIPDGDVAELHRGLAEGPPGPATEADIENKPMEFALHARPQYGIQLSLPMVDRVAFGFPLSRE